MRSHRSLLTTALAAGLAVASSVAFAGPRPRSVADLAAPAAPASATSNNTLCPIPCQPLPLLTPGALLISGSTTVRPITERAETFFQALKPVDITVLAPGSGAGRRALLEGQCARVGGFPSCDLNADNLIDAPVDLAESSSPMPAAEKTFAAAHGCCLAEYTVAIDGLGIIVHKTNAATFPSGLNVGGLMGAPPANQVASIYTGVVQNYAGVGGNNLPIHAYSRTFPSGTFDSFLALYGMTQPSLMPACPGAAAQGCIKFLGSNDEIAAAVAADPNGIGYVGVGFLGANSNIAAIPQRKTGADALVTASFDTVQNGTFAFTRKLFYYACGVPAANDLRGRFIDFVMSRTGQAIVAETGFVPEYNLNGVTENKQALLEPAIEDVLAIDADRIQEVLAFLAGGTGTPTEIAEATSFLHEQWAGDSSIVGPIVNRAVACGIDPARAAQALAAYNAAVAAATATPADYAGANLLLQQALDLADGALR